MKYGELVNEIAGSRFPKLLELFVGYRKSSFAEMQKLCLYGTVNARDPYNPVGLIFCENRLINKIPNEYQLIRNLGDLYRLTETYSNKNRDVCLIHVILEDENVRDSINYEVNDLVIMSNNIILDIKPYDFMKVKNKLQIPNDGEEELTCNPEAMNDLDSALENKKKLEGK